MPALSPMFPPHPGKRTATDLLAAQFRYSAGLSHMSQGGVRSPTISRDLTLQYHHGSSTLPSLNNFQSCVPTPDPHLAQPNPPESYRSVRQDEPLRPQPYQFRSQVDHTENIVWGIDQDNKYLPTTLVHAPAVTELLEVEEMKQVKTKCTIGILSTLITYMCINSWYRVTHPNAFVWCQEDLDNAKWVATSKSWLDRKACRWLGVCGWFHMHFAQNPFGGELHVPLNVNLTEDGEWRNEWIEEKVHFLPIPNDNQKQLLEDEKRQRNIPSYVFEYAPLIHLYSNEQFWPCDPAEHLFHTTPRRNYTSVLPDGEHATLTNLDRLNQLDHGKYIFLTSNDDVETRPEWLEGRKNIPKVLSAEGASLDDNEGWVHHPARTYLQGIQDAARVLGKDLSRNGDLNALDTGDADSSDETVSLLRKEAEALLDEELRKDSVRSGSVSDVHKIRGGKSSAPAILITVQKPDGVLDAFWFFFYSFNLGNSVLGFRFGNHIGDWEHTAVRFKNGIPLAVYFSEHNFGSAYSYQAVEKRGKRPVIYSATGTHAMYSTPGEQDYVLPFGLLHDMTDRGPLWDPALNYHSYTYDHHTDVLRSSNVTPNAPTGWFHFAGHWGDKFYQLGDERQYRFVGQYHYVNGPLGPKFKNLGRKEICGGPDGTPCVIKHWLGNGGRVNKAPNNGEEADEFSKAYKEARFELR